MTDPQYSSRLPHDERVERITWTLFSALLIMVGLWLVVPFLDTDSSADTVTSSTDSTDEASVGDGAADDSGSATGSDAGTDATADDVEAATPGRFTVVASGDILIHGRVAEAAQTDSGYDFRPLFQNVKPIIEGADLGICHLEIPLSSTNQDLVFGEAGVYRAPNQIADAIADTGFDLCSAASNHSYDSGQSSVVSTVEQLSRVGLSHTGIATSLEGASTRWRRNVNGVTVGHLAYTYGLNGRDNADVPAHEVARINEAAILAQAAEHRAGGSEFIIVSLHWGEQYQAEPSDFQTTLGPRLLADANIDLIIGHHAHVPQRIEEIDGEYLVYGLGNFLSNQSPNAPECPNDCTVETQDGLIVRFTVDTADDGTIGVANVEVIPTWVDVGTTWEIFDTTLDAQPSGATSDAAVLSASRDRTLATMLG